MLGATVDRGIIDGDRDALWSGATAMLLLGVVVAISDAGRHTCETLAQVRVQAELREAVARVALDADESHRDTWPPSELVARATADVDKVAEATENAAWLVAQTVVIPVAVGALVLLDPVLAAAVVVTVALSVALTWVASTGWSRRTEVAQEAMAGYVAEAHAVMEGYKVVRGAGAEAGVAAGLARRSAEVRDRTVATSRLWVGFAPVLEVLTGIAVVAVLWVGGERVIDGQLELGEVVGAAGLALFLAEPMGSIGHGFVVMRQALVSARRLAELVPDVSPEPAGPGEGDLVLTARGVRFAYPGRDEPVLDGIDLTLRQGQLAVLAGPVGSGKSTLAALLAGERSPHGGVVALRGRSLAEWPLDDRHAAVVLLGPAPFLLAASVAENLRLGAPGASDAELAAALELARASEVVAGLPEGLATVLADRGVSLSGGERQRIALARAVLARPQVLVLDGATSGLEPAREEALLADLAGRWGHGVLVVVSPNPVLRDRADVVLELGA